MTGLYLLALALLASLVGNAFLLFKAKKTKVTESYEVKQLLSDLARGSALVRITRIDPEHVMLRSPRDL